MPLPAQAWFEAEGVALKCEPDGRVFPSTDDSATIIDALLSAAARAGVDIRTGARVVGARRGDWGELYELRLGGPEAREDPFVVLAPAVLLATGSTSHELAAALGHELTPLIPSLFSFRLCDAERPVPSAPLRPRRSRALNGGRIASPQPARRPRLRDY